MATSIAPNIADAFLDALHGGAPVSFTDLWIQLHIGEPGPDGTANVAGNSARRLLPLSAASGGAMATTDEVHWNNVPGTEDYTHASVWSASTGGTFIGSGAVAADPIVAGDYFMIPEGDLVIVMEVAS